MHQSPFVKDGSWVDRIGETWVFNAGQQFGVPPTHIIIDTDAAKRCGSPRPAIRSSALAIRSSGRCSGSKPSPTGSQPRIGLALRALRELLVLLVDQRLEHLSDHAEMVALPLELALQVDQIGGRGVEALGEQPAQARTRSRDWT